jgi:hypothetical protein
MSVYVCVSWTWLAQDNLCERRNEHSCFIKYWNFLCGWTTFGFSRRPRLHGGNESELVRTKSCNSEIIIYKRHCNKFMTV